MTRQNEEAHIIESSFKSCIKKKKTLEKPHLRKPYWYQVLW
jgi:hypothetical protein